MIEINNTKTKIINATERYDEMCFLIGYFLQLSIEFNIANSSILDCIEGISVTHQVDSQRDCSVKIKRYPLEISTYFTDSNSVSISNIIIAT